MTNWDMKMYEELLRATEQENGTLYPMSEGTVYELMERVGTSHDDVLGVKFVRLCNKEDFSCGDEYILMEIVDAEKLRNVTLNMDWSEAITYEESEDDIKMFSVGYTLEDIREMAQTDADEAMFWYWAGDKAVSMVEWVMRDGYEKPLIPDEIPWL
tara:strand:- start:1453 stop:1920 length:468 start_codon:yes stop_codon:yes gene_type:complete